jgi:thiol-disulfide isomerase/thioredoxin
MHTRIAFFVAAAAAAALVAHVMAQQEPRTLAECLAVLEKLPQETAAEMRAAGKTVDSQTLDKLKAERAASYAARFPIARVTGADLVLLAKLLGEANQRDQARAAIEKRVAMPGTSVGDRGDALVAGIEIALNRPVTDEGRRQAAADLAQLDTLGAGALRQQCAAYSRMVSLNRGSKTPDERILTRFLALYAALDPAQRDPFRFGRYLAYEIRANTAHVQGNFDREQQLLREGVQRFTPDPGDKRELDITRQLLDRAELVGKAAPAISAEHWINGEPMNHRIDLAGHVSIIEFTAHWCGPCRESYPGLLRLHEEFANRGVRIVLATRLWGYFGSDRNVTPEQELASDFRLFVDEDKLPFPVAVATPPAASGPADVSDVNAKAYFVQPIPQFVVVDRHGIVRKVDVGWEPADEEAMKALVQKLLIER